MNNRIKQIREQLNLSQDKFGAAIGLSQRSISTLEKGASNLTDRNFNAICREFNVNPTWLETGEGEMFLPSTSLERLAHEYELTADEMALIKNFVQLPAEDRAVILKLMKNFARDALGVKLPGEDRKPDDQLTVEEKRRIMNEELDAEEKGQILSAFTGTSGIKKSRRFSR